MCAQFWPGTGIVRIDFRSVLYRSMGALHSHVDLPSPESSCCILLHRGDNRIQAYSAKNAPFGTRLWIPLTSPDPLRAPYALRQVIYFGDYDRLARYRPKIFWWIIDFRKLFGLVCRLPLRRTRPRATRIYFGAVEV
jgi:hypothetical protein